MALAGTGDVDQALTAAIADPSPAVRLGVLLALRRLGSPVVAKFLADSDPLIVREAALAINDAPINDGLPALAALLDKATHGEVVAFRPIPHNLPGFNALIDKPLTDEAVGLRVLNAHFRLGQPANATALASFAASSAAPAALRAEALAQLALWAQPPQRDRLVGTYRPLTPATRDRAVAVNALRPHLTVLLTASSPAAVQTATLKAMQDLEIAGATDALFAAVKDDALSGESRVAALTTLDKVKDPRLAEAVTLASASSSSALRLAALPIAARISPAAAAPVIGNLLAKGTAEEQKAAFRSLGVMRHPGADRLLADQLRQLAAGKVAAGAQLELLNAAARRSDPAIKDILAQRTAALAANPDPLAPHRVALAGGNASRGEQIFRNQPTLACIRCHRAGTDGGDAGPNLAGIGAKQSREQLLESIVKPNAKIAPGFDTVVVTRRDGSVAAGIVASETAAALTLRNTDNQLVEVRKADIAKREGAPSGMPEIYGAILTPTQLRDVVEYMASLKEAVVTLDENKPRALRGLPPPPKPAE